MRGRRRAGPAGGSAAREHGTGGALLSSLLSLLRTSADSSLPPPRPAPLPQVPLDADTCEVESPWGDQGTAVLDEELCAILAGPGGIREYATSRLMAIWGLGSPLQPPA